MTFPLTLAHLTAAGAAPREADMVLAPLNLAMLEFQITVNERPAMFLAQVAHESAGFKYTSEIWGPTPAQAGYEGRSDLGNTKPGDGSKFRGHGYIEITGRYNHQIEADFFGVDIDAVIPILQSPLGACRSAAHWWHRNGCNAFADAYDFILLTKRINGGLNGLADRLARYQRIVAVMS